MSDDAIRLELSQERLRRELAKGPANYRAIARAELEVRRSEQQLVGENARLERQFRETSAQANKMGRGMLAGSGALRGLGRNLAFASAGFLGGTGLVYGMRSAIDAASNLDEQTNKVRVTFRASGEDIINWSKTTATSIGLASDQALQYAGTLGGILNASGLARRESAGLSRELVQLSSDMASFNNTSIEDALEAIRSGLVGESEPLRRFQVLLTEANVSQEALRMTGKKSAQELTQGEKVLARYHLILQQTTDQQGDYARTSDGLANSQRTLSALWRETQILVGQALVPAYKDAVQGMRDWLAEDKNRESLQRTVNTVVSDGEKIVRGFAGALKIAVNAAEPLSAAVGGVGNAIRIITLAWIAWKAKAVLSFVGTAAASRAASGSMVRDAAVAGRAWDIATRPRTMTVTTVGGGAAGGAGRGGTLTRGLGMLGLTPGGAIIAAGAAAIYLGLRSHNQRAIDDREFNVLKQAAVTGELSYEDVNRFPTWALSDQRKAVLRGLIARHNAQGVGARPQEGRGPGAVAAETARRTRRDRARTARGWTFAQFESQQAGIQERQLDAEASPGSADDAREARAELALVRRALAELELTRDQRVALKQRRNTLLSEIAGIEAEGEQEAQAIRDKQVAARKAAREKREAREKAEHAAEEAAMERTIKRAQTHYDRMEKLTKGTDFSTRAGLRRAALRFVDSTGKPKGGVGADRDKPLTAAELQRMQWDFITGLHGVLGQFGGNVGSGAGDFGMLETHAQLQTAELEKQTKAMKEFTGAARSPGTGYVRSELTAAVFGYGF